jgi:hypothetical protein
MLVFCAVLHSSEQPDVCPANSGPEGQMAQDKSWSSGFWRGGGRHCLVLAHAEKVVIAVGILLVLGIENVKVGGCDICGTRSMFRVVKHISGCRISSRRSCEARQWMLNLKQVLLRGAPLGHRSTFPLAALWCSNVIEDHVRQSHCWVREEHTEREREKQTIAEDDGDKRIAAVKKHELWIIWCSVLEKKVKDHVVVSMIASWTPFVR